MKTPLLLETQVLQLNKLWMPLRYRSVGYALTKLFNASKEQPLLPVHIELDANGQLGAGSRPMSVEEWMAMPHDDAYPVIHMTRGRVMHIPLVVITPSYQGIPKTNLRLNKRGLFIRDKGLCAYCRHPITLDESTIDHVVPRDSDGKTTWENTVLSCAPCNGRKANRTPKDAGMLLHVLPKIPHGRPVHPGYLPKPSPIHLAILGNPSPDRQTQMEMCPLRDQEARRERKSRRQNRGHEEKAHPKGKARRRAA
jgi:hypothetical protein